MKFIGYHSNSELPVKPGDTVTIQKGVTVRTVLPKSFEEGFYVHKVKARRSYKIKVSHVLNGTTRYKDLPENERSRCTNPSVVWAGRGGYWREVDINDVPEAIEA